MHFQLLGPVRAFTDDGTEIPLPGARSRAVLGRLLLAEEQSVARDVLIAELWQEGDAKNPLNALQVQVTKLRASLSADGAGARIVTEGSGYRLRLSPLDSNDVSLFVNLLAAGREALATGRYGTAETALRDALALWHGDALADIPMQAFESDRLRLEELRATALDDAVTAGLATGRAKELIPELRSLVTRHPLRERSRGQLMRALETDERHAEALEVYGQGRDLLLSELGLDPSPELTDLQSAIRLSAAGRSDPLPGNGPEDTGSWPHRPDGNLPRPLGPFVGRQSVQAGLIRAMSQHRVVSIVGPGGVGKTRLALEACLEIQQSYDGAWWTELASVHESGLPQALASMIGLTGIEGADAHPDSVHEERLATFIGDRAVLLALDNCEHVLNSVAPLVNRLLNRCPHLTILTTSREPLSVPGESLCPLDPLEPEDAAQLFRLRATAVDPSFSADNDTLRDVREVCRRLDGLPLAIELAAAHTRLLPVGEISRRLDDRFRLLTRGGRTAPQRHRTLLAVLDWSYALLNDGEKQTLTELAVFTGGVSVQAAEQFSSSGNGGKPDAPNIYVLGQLVDKSLLIPAHGPNGARLRMLETIREYALDRLTTEGRISQAYERLTAWAMEIVKQASIGLSSARQAYWTSVISEELPNLRAATEHLIRSGRAAEALILQGGISYYWFVSGKEEEGLDLMLQTLKAYDALSPGDRHASPESEQGLSFVLSWIPWLSHTTGQSDNAAVYGRRHHEHWVRSHNPLLDLVGPVGDALHAMLAGDARAQVLFEKAAKGLAGTGMHWAESVLRGSWSSHCLRLDDTAGARQQASMAVDAARVGEDAFALAFSLILRGDADEYEHEDADARESWTEASRTLREIGARMRYAYALLRLAYLDQKNGDVASAHTRLDEVEQVASELSSPNLSAAAMNLRGVVALRDGRFEDAEDLFSRVWNGPRTQPGRKAVASFVLELMGSAGEGTAARVRRRTAGDDGLEAPLSDPVARRAVKAVVDGRREESPERRLRTLGMRDGQGPSTLAAFC
ncbi:AfsR/SARP family transcriptional regulator [Streptomyces sp. NPDC087844]|uniref:AfsR/SARP family transcriptional regulator n=1 Tax=Streptomyces sp. NPDC087844 TaxID=3365805 RepID=UPI00382128EE